MDILMTLGIFLAIVVIVYMAVKGVSVLIAAPIASIIVIITNKMEFFPSLIGTENSYMTSLTGFIINFFAIFLLGAILAKYIDESGAAQTIAQKILEKTGSERAFPVLLAIYIITALLTYGGISLFVVLFVIVPLAVPLFKQLKIAWNIVPLPLVLGFGTFTMTMLPGTPSVQNVIPTRYLGTTLTAAPVLGLVGTVVAIIFSVWYLRFVLKNSIKRGETFSDFYTEDKNDLELKKQTPPFFQSILPLLILIGIILVGSALKVNNIILIGLTASIISAGLLFVKYIPSHKKIINAGATDSISPIFLTSSAVAFGGIVTIAPGFQAIFDFILNIPGNPLISLSIASASFSAITGSSSGAVGIVLQAFGQSYLDMGVSPEAIHKVSSMGSGVFTNMPHSGVVLTLLTVTGLTHKNAFKYIFTGPTVANLLAIIAVIITYVLFF